MAELDLRDLHGRHEPDPAFRRALRERVVTVGRQHPSTTEANTDPREEPVMLTDTRTDGPDDPRAHQRGRRRSLFAAAAALVAIAGIAAALLDRSSDDDRSPIASGTDVVFEDDFDDETGRWQTEEGIRIEGGQQVWQLGAGQRLHLRPLAAEQRLLDMETTAEVSAVDMDSTVGVHCRKGAQNEDAYYFFRLGPTAASIGVLPLDQSAAGEVLATEDLPRPPAPFTLTARCVDVSGRAELSLLVDGDVVLEVTHDEPLGPGFGAIEVQAGAPGEDPSQIRWEGFAVSSIG
jgi:hypothetical protein